MSGAVWAVVVAAGSGSRFGGRKQFARLGPSTLVAWSVAAARAACDGVVAVFAHDDIGHPSLDEIDADRVVAGGPTRSASVRCGLAAVPDSASIVVVHDAARPLAGRSLWAAAIAAVLDGGADGAVCAVALTDTIKRVDGTLVVATVARDDLVAVQTPQAFRADVLRRAHADSGEATDDAALVEAIGGRVVVVAGDPRNLKITHPSDLAAAAALIDQTP